MYGGTWLTEAFASGLKLRGEIKAAVFVASAGRVLYDESMQVDVEAHRHADMCWSNSPQHMLPSLIFRGWLIHKELDLSRQLCTIP